MINKPLIPIIVVLVAMLAGCAAKEELIAKSAAVPAGVDISGRWLLRDESQDTVQQISDAELAAAGGKESIIAPSERKTQRSKNRSSKGTLVHVFVETGNSLKVTQTEFGLFISFDRAIVEEYRFGEKRMINVGPIEAQRVSGWEGARYVIETLDDDGAKLVETYRLDDGGNSLIRTIRIIEKGVNQVDVEQGFNRN